MGWANCGEDSRGRPIGYAHAATCDEPGCEAAIDRGLAYKCGPMHGAGSYYCEDYFCEKHLRHHDHPDGAGSVCARCFAEMSYREQYGEDEEP